MAVCDLSTQNPNVLFELGLRQAFDKPVTLIQEKGTPQIFDIAPLRYTEYRRQRIYNQVLEDQEAIAAAITATAKASKKGDGLNSMVNLLSLVSPAALKEFGGDEISPMMQVLQSEIGALRNDFRRAFREQEEGRPSARFRETASEISSLEKQLAEAESYIRSSFADPDRLYRGTILCEQGMLASNQLAKKVPSESIVGRELNNILMRFHELLDEGNLQRHTRSIDERKGSPAQD